MLNAPRHVGPPIAPDELWTSWNSDPLVWTGLVTVAATYLWASARRHGAGARRRRAYFLGALAALLVALVSPLDAIGVSLASAHMVQHLVLTTVAAPLLVLAAPVRTISAALGPDWRLVLRAGRRSAPARLAHALVERPVLAGLPFVVVLAAWHLPAPYEAALDHHLLHGAEHVMMLATAVLSWAAILLAARRRRRDRAGSAILVLFGLSTTSGLLGLLLAFSPQPLYPSYEATAPRWHLSALADQQLAGVIMWVPGGAVYLAAALIVLVGVLRLDGGPSRTPDDAPARQPSTTPSRS